VHASNIYQDGNMPFMQRHHLDGHRHACRCAARSARLARLRALPYAFAQRLFGLTDIGCA